MNCLHLDINNRTPEAKLHNVDQMDIPVKNFHPLFCPVYVLDHRLQTAGGAGPPKWDPRSRIGVYCGHSPFHAGNVALIFNPKTGLLSPQYHCVYDDEFTTVACMERGEVPPNWPNLYRYSKELSTEAEFTLASEWLASRSTVKKVCDFRPLDQPVAEAPGSTARDRITDPFDVIPDQDGVERCDKNSTVPPVTLPPSRPHGTHARENCSSLAPVENILEVFKVGSVGTAMDFGFESSNSHNPSRVSKPRAPNNPEQLVPIQAELPQIKCPSALICVRQDCVGAPARPNSGRK